MVNPETLTPLPPPEGNVGNEAACNTTTMRGRMNTPEAKMVPPNPPTPEELKAAEQSRTEAFNQALDARKQISTPPPPPPESNIRNEPAANAATGSTGEAPPKARKKQPRSVWKKPVSDSDRSLTPANHAAAKIFENNQDVLVIPTAWYHHLRTKTGPDDIAIALLAEIVYWFRPTKDKKRKFKSDQLQKYISDFTGEFGYSYHQVSRALARLEDAGLITKELRNIPLPTGRNLGNVLFIDLNPGRLLEISTPPSSANMRQGDDPSRKNPASHAANMPQPFTQECDKHYTETARTETEGQRKKKEKKDCEAGQSPASSFSSSSADNPPGAEGESSSPTPNSNPAIDSPEKVIEAIEALYGYSEMSEKDLARAEKLVRKGVLTVKVIEALAEAKMQFDQKPARWKGKAYIPYNPERLFKDYGKSLEGVVFILAEENYSLERKLPESDEDSVTTQLRALETFFQQYEWWAKKGTPEWEKEFGLIFSHLLLCVNEYGTEAHPVVVPEWLRIVWLHRHLKDIDLSPGSTSCQLMIKAAEQIENDPRVLRFPGVDMPDDAILRVFKIDYQPVAEGVAKLEEERWDRMYKLQELIVAVADARETCTGR